MRIECHIIIFLPLNRVMFQNVCLITLHVDIICKNLHFHYSIKYNDTKKNIYAILRLKGKQEKMEDIGE